MKTTTILCMNKTFILVINGKDVAREISIIRTGDLNSKGKVGKATYYWDRKKHELPIVFLNGKRHRGDLVCRQVAFFLLSWAEEVTRPRKTHFCYTDHDARELATTVAESKGNYDSNYISGHPKWLTEAKEPVKCYSRTTGEFLYERRAVIPVDMKELAESYVPNYCSKCMYRVTCETPCESPNAKSEEQVIVA